jgi:hypothetical protein
MSLGQTNGAGPVPGCDRVVLAADEDVIGDVAAATDRAQRRGHSSADRRREIHSASEGPKTPTHDEVVAARRRLRADTALIERPAFATRACARQAR